MTAKKQLPFMSIVMIGYNDGSVLHRTFTSLMAQDYPHDRREIIFVNDGSTDNTDEVVAQFPEVKYVKFDHNVGIPTARTAGFKVAKGDIYTSFDSDCVAEPDWLRQIARGYELIPDAAGIGGVIVDMDVPGRKDIATSYIEATGRGATRQADDDTASRRSGLLQKLGAYLTAGLARPQNPSAVMPDYMKVDELYGANSSFPMATIRAVGAWDLDMAAPAIGGIEDRDICARIRRAFPDRHFYAMTHARLMHEPGMPLKRYLLRPYRRGQFNYLFHLKNRLMPPIFPFPPLIALMLLGTAVAMPLLLPVAALLLPHICYFWWLQRAVVEKRPLFLLFPYIQLAEETMVIAGLIRGFFVHNVRKHEVR